MTPPTEAELFALAERALEHAGEEAQVTAWWERRAWAARGAAGARAWTSVEVLVVRDGAAGRVVTEDGSPDGLRWAATAAARVAEGGGEPHPGLPDPAPGRPHDGWDAAALTADPAVEAGRLGPGERWAAAAARTAIVSTRGVRAFEQRTHVRAGRGAGELAAVGPAALPQAAEAAPPELTGASGEPVEPGEYAAVLGPTALAGVIRSLPPLGAYRGRRVAAATVNLSESPRFAATLPRSYDAEGRPLAPAPLIQDGVATGNEAGDHPVLVGGGAAGVEELAATLKRGLYLPAPGVALPIRDGVVGDGPGLPVPVEIAPLELLATAQALTSRQWTVPTGRRSARTAGATVCPAGRFGGGVRVL